MTKTYDPTTSSDPQTMAMTHQAAHDAIHEDILPQTSNRSWLSTESNTSPVS